MKIEKPNRPLAALLLALAVALSSAPAGAQQASCNSALTELDDYASRNNVSAIDPNNPGYRGCCLAIRAAVASREAVRICEAEGVNNPQIQQIKTDLAGLPSSLPLSTCNAQPGGSSSCSEYPAISFAPTTSQPDPFLPPPPRLPPPTQLPITRPITVPNITVPDIEDESDNLLYWGAGVAVVGVIAVAAWENSNPSLASAFTARPIAFFQNDNGRTLERYGMRIEYRRADSPLSLRWSAEELRTAEAESTSALFGGEWRGEVWRFSGEAAQRDSRATLGLRVGAALARAGWELRLDAKSFAWNEGFGWSEPETEFLLGMEKAF